MDINDFTVAVAEADLGHLRRRLDDVRWSPEIANDDWSYGISGEYLRDLVEYWKDSYDWRAHEADINALANFRAEIDGTPVHFVHERGRGPNPLPLILTHGWPWTFWDWHALIGPLTDPAAFGGDPADSFDVVVPSLPGFGFSNPLPLTGVTPPTIAQRWDALMREGLGYDRYGAAGGDWGSFVTSELGIQYPDRLAGVYLSLQPLFHIRANGEPVPGRDYRPDEQDWPERHAQRRAAIGSHVLVHTTDPQTLAWSLNDSPVGLAAWLIERRRNWSDCDGDVERAFSRDFLLTTVSLYWHTQTIASSMLIYAESLRGGGANVHSTRPPSRIDVPTGIGVFPYDLALYPRSACERVANLVHWSVLPHGGHFGPAEQPELYVEELRTFFRPLR